MRFVKGLVFCALPFVLNAQPPLGIVRGRVLECDSAKPAGQFSIRTEKNQVFRFSFDAKTYAERNEQQIPIGKLQPGDQVEIICDKAPATTLRYARTVDVVEPTRQTPQLRAAIERFQTYSTYSSPLDDLFPRGNLTFSGVVRQLNEERLVLRMREGGDKVIQLRPDTKYIEDGARVQVSVLKPNTRVFVRAGTNLDNEVEAYQVVWGRILMPGGPR